MSENKKNRIWTFLNSSVGGWLLGTVLVAIFSQVYNYQKNRNELELDIKQADLEIEGRLSQFLTSIRPLVVKINDSTYKIKDSASLAIFNTLWRELKQPPSVNKYIFTIYDKFQNSSVVSVMEIQADNLRALGHDIIRVKFENEADLLAKDIKTETKKIEDAVVNIMANHTIEYDTAANYAVMERIRLMYSHIILSRWTLSWPYTDGLGF